jgi:hypothetical protein
MEKLLVIVIIIAINILAYNIAHYIVYKLTHGNPHLAFAYLWIFAAVGLLVMGLLDNE